MNLIYSKSIRINNSKETNGKENEFFFYDLDFLKFKGFYRSLVESPTNRKFPSITFETGLYIFKDFYSLKALDFNLKKITISIKKSKLVEFPKKLKFQKHILLFFRNKKYFIILNPNCFIGTFMKNNFYNKTGFILIKWSFQIFLSLKIFRISNFLSNYFKKKKKLTDVCSVLALKARFLNVFTLIDLTSKRILVEILFPKTFKKPKTEEISYGLSGNLSLKKPFVRRNRGNNLLFYFIFKLCFMFLYKNRTRIEYILIRLETFFFSIQINFRSLKPVRKCFPFRFCWLMKAESCIGFNLWIKTTHENWGSMEPKFKDLEKGIKKDIELYSCFLGKNKKSKFQVI